MELVDDEIAEASEHSPRLAALCAKNGFNGFRGDQKHSVWGLHELGLLAEPDVAMPGPHRYVQGLAKPLQPGVLIVDQGLNGADVHNQTRRFTLDE